VIGHVFGRYEALALTLSTKYNKGMQTHRKPESHCATEAFRVCHQKVISKTPEIKMGT
jgi:hypothetical protein